MNSFNNLVTLIVKNGWSLADVKELKELAKETDPEPKDPEPKDPAADPEPKDEKDEEIKKLRKQVADLQKSNAQKELGNVDERSEDDKLRDIFKDYFN